MYSAKWSELGQQERIEPRRGARRVVSRIDGREADLRLAHAEGAQQRRRSHRRLDDALAGRGDRFGRRADPPFVVFGQEKRAQERAVDAVAERELPVAERPAANRRHAAGLSSSSTRRSECQSAARSIQRFPGAPVKPDA